MDSKSSTYYHSPAVQEFNRRARHADESGAEEIDLSEHALLAQARMETGLEQFGDESFLPAMRTLLLAGREEADLNPFGRFVLKSHTVRALKNRLWANAAFEAHPDIREQKIVAPIIIVGPHRSGTTRMQRMLAADTRLQHLTTWEGVNPAPRLREAELGHANRYQEAKKMFEGRHLTYPDACIAHPMAADWPEEEMLLLNQSFAGFLPLGLYAIPDYYRWFLNADKSVAYREMGDLMRLIAWSRGESGSRRWILKGPQHMLSLDLLLTIFPDAKLIFTHRDPLKTVGSVLSLMWSYASQHTDLACRAKISGVWLDFCEQMARRGMQARASIPATQQLDIHYEDMNRDWRGVMRRVYAFSEMEFTAQAEQAMCDWLKESTTDNRHAAHRYALEDFGVSEQEVDARMMFVRERYAIPYEKK